MYNTELILLIDSVFIGVMGTYYIKYQARALSVRNFLSMNLSLICPLITCGRVLGYYNIQ